MLVLAALPKPQFARLHLAVASDFSLSSTSTWQDTLDSIQKRPIEVAVVDPCLTGEPRLQELERVHALFPSLPILIYTPLTPSAAGLLLHLGRLNIRRVLFVRHDDHPTQLRQELRLERERSVAQRLIRALSELFDPLPAAARWAVEAALTDPADVSSVDVLADRCGVDRRTCQRWFTQASLAPPHDILSATRLLHAHALLQDPGYTVDDVAQRLGYGQVKTLQHHARDILGVPPGELRLSIPPGKALDTVRRYIVRETRDSAQSAS